ncbi:MAG: DUF3515 domain-containing protein [Labedaea sp.]
MPDRSAPETFSRATVGVAAGLAGLLIVGVIVLGKVLAADGTSASGPAESSAPPSTGPVALVPVEAPQAGSPPCAALLGALPAALVSGGATLRRLPLAEPAPPATAAWGDGRGDPVVLRCGLVRPPELTPTAQLREISGVRWLPVEGEHAITWYLVSRAVFVALTTPEGTGTGVLQGVSETAAKTLDSA